LPPLDEPQVPSVVGLDVGLEVGDEDVVEEDDPDDGESVVVWCGTVVPFTGATQ
jgi:hypothetical protein